MYGDFDPYESCYGCPKRVSGCHGSCKGYQYRAEKNRLKNEYRSFLHAADPRPPRSEIDRRNRRLRKLGRKK